MNFLVLKKNNLFEFLENIKSENLGFYFSFLLHLLILILVIGIPNFFESKKINVPTIIPIEIINVTDNTSIPKEVIEKNKSEIKQVEIKKKKFNSSENQEIIKNEIKVKPEIEKKKIDKNIMLKDDIIIKEKNLPPTKLEKTKIDTNQFENLPTKKIKPKLKPKKNNVTEVKKNNTDMKIENKPKVKPEPEFTIASMLKDLRNEQTNLKSEEIKNEKKEIISDNPDEKIEVQNAQLTISEIDLLRQQLSSCWNAPAGAVIEKGMLVKVSAKIKQNRRIIDNSVRIIDTNIPINNSFYGPITESAMRTLLNPECIPLKLPEDKYDLWKRLTITFDYSIMKGY